MFGSLCPEADDFAFILTVGLYAIIVLFLFIHISSKCIYRYCDCDDFITEQRHSRRARQQRQRQAEEPLPLYMAEDPIAWRLLDTDAGAHPPPPAYHTIVVTVPPYYEDEDEARERNGTTSNVIVVPSRYVVHEEGVREAHMPDDVVYMV
ncbi:hypothetical protein ColLi_01529 [Colletotrichum liriopes]|uniref:Uncharacterized protein n=1 Tax=Colletotrichum liriopes TaxID=708192 RepID=A0AA37GD30_9PEZI|nr:hypothetical protein ColLi_01529 [Colletotrichum liriopes]